MARRGYGNEGAAPEPWGRSPFPSDLRAGPGQRRTKLGRIWGGEGRLSRLLVEIFSRRGETVQVLGQGRIPPGWSRDSRTYGGPGRTGADGRARGEPTTFCLASASSLGPSAWTLSPGPIGRMGVTCWVDQIIWSWLPLLLLHPQAFLRGSQVLPVHVAFPFPIPLSFRGGISPLWPGRAPAPSLGHRNVTWGGGSSADSLAEVGPDRGISPLTDWAA